MNLNPVEWLKAQDLLVELVQVLTPLTERVVPASFFLSRRFLIPSAFTQDDFEPVPIRHPVRLLTDLHSVQRKVEKWIGDAAQETVANEVVERPAAKIENKPRAQALKETAPLSKQAQTLIRQVQNAIEKLSTSTYIQNPIEGPLREALQKLKPNLDQIIDSVSHEKVPEQNLPGFFRHPVPRSSREELVAKLLTPSKAPEGSPDQSADPEAPRSPIKGARRDVEAEALEMPKDAEATPPLKKSVFEKGRGEGRNESQPTPPPVGKESIAQGQKEARPSPRPLEVIALPGAPFVSHTKNLLHPGKKKKRKGFWYKGEEEDRNNS